MTVTEIVTDFIDLYTQKSKMEGKLPSKSLREKERSLFMRKNCEINAGEKIYRCKVCDLSFKSMKNIREHVLKSHASTMCHTCESCGKSFPTAKRLENHKACHEPSQDYTCGVCRKVCTNRKAFTKHQWSHENIPKQFVCEECGKIFPNRERLKTHSRVHSGEKPFPCETCSACFATAFQLKLHSRVHSGERPHSCDVCGKGFAAACGLQQHKRTHTKESPYSCDYCGNQFRQMEKLKQHLRIHTGSRPFMCDRCPKTFRIKTALTRHLRIHSGETYKCIHCIKKFTELYALKRHHGLRHSELEFTGAAENDSGDQTSLSSTVADNHPSERNNGELIINSEINLKPKNKLLSDSQDSHDFTDGALMHSGDVVSQSLVFENGWTRIPLEAIGNSKPGKSQSLREDENSSEEMGQRERQNLPENADGEMKKNFVPYKERQQFDFLPMPDGECSVKTRTAAPSEQTTNLGHSSHCDPLHHGHTHTIRYFPDSANFQASQDQVAQSRLLELPVPGPSAVTGRSGSVSDYYFQGMTLHQGTTETQNAGLYHSPPVAGRKLYDLSSNYTSTYPHQHLASQSHHAAISTQGCTPGMAATGFLDPYFPQHQGFHHSRQHQRQHHLNQQQLPSGHQENHESDLQRSLHLQQQAPAPAPSAPPQRCQLQQKLCQSDMAVNNVSVYTVNQVLHEGSSMKSQHTQGSVVQKTNSENLLHQPQVYQQVYTYYDQFGSQGLHQAESQDVNMEKGLPYFTPTLSYGQAQSSSTMAQNQHRQDGFNRVRSVRSLGHCNTNTQTPFESFTPYLGSSELEAAGTVVHHKPASCESVGGQRLFESQKNSSHCGYNSQIIQSSHHDVSHYGCQSSQTTLQPCRQGFESTPQQTNLHGFYKIPVSSAVQGNTFSYAEGNKKHAENSTGCPNKDIHLLTSSKKDDGYCLYLDEVDPTAGTAKGETDKSLLDEANGVVMNSRMNSGTKGDLSKRAPSHKEPVGIFCESENALSKSFQQRKECSLPTETSEGVSMTNCEDENVESPKELTLTQVDEQCSFNKTEAGQLHQVHVEQGGQFLDAEIEIGEVRTGRSKRHDAGEKDETNLKHFRATKSEEGKKKPRRSQRRRQDTIVWKAETQSRDSGGTSPSRCTSNSNNSVNEQKGTNTEEAQELSWTNEMLEKLKQMTHVEKYYKHNASKQQYQCLICLKSNKTLSLLQKHILFTHFEEGKPKCHECQKVFPQIYRLKRHLLTHNPGKSFPCLFCHRTFKQSDTLENHLQTCSKKTERRFVCTECKKSFPTAYQLKVHFRTHSGEKPYACSFCLEKFATSFQVRQHERVHTGLRPYKCTMCTKEFASNSGLVTHIKYHTGEKPFLCASCGAAFQEASKLRAHVRIHTGAHPFMCDRCPKRFKVKHLLVRHMRWHTGDLFHCHKCGKDFDEKYILKAHIGKRHSSSSAS